MFRLNTQNAAVLTIPDENHSLKARDKYLENFHSKYKKNSKLFFKRLSVQIFPRVLLIANQANQAGLWFVKLFDMKLNRKP